MITISSINDTIPLKGMLMLYSQHGTRSDGTAKVYVEYRKVEGEQLQAPVPLSMDSLEDLYTYMVGRKMGSGQLAGSVPSKLIYMNPTLNIYVWKVPGGKRDVKMARGAGLKKGWIKYPPMVFAVNGKTLSIFVYRSSIKKIYPAPFFNVYDDGAVCLGTVKLNSVNNAKTYDEYFNAWEHLFFNSKYSHGIGDVMKIMKGLVNSRKFFPWKRVAKILKPISLKSLFR
jgi:PRTRC genetic system protein B